MVGVLLTRVLAITLHITILGGLVEVDHQVQNGRVIDAFTHTAVISICIVLFAVAGYFATKLLGKSADNLRIDIRRVPARQSRRRQNGKHKRTSGVRRGSKSNR